MESSDLEELKLFMEVAIPDIQLPSPLPINQMEIQYQIPAALKELLQYQLQYQTDLL